MFTGPPQRVFKNPNSQYSLILTSSVSLHHLQHAWHHHYLSFILYVASTLVPLRYEGTSHTPQIFTQGRAADCVLSSLLQLFYPKHVPRSQLPLSMLLALSLRPSRSHHAATRAQEPLLSQQRCA